MAFVFWKIRMVFSELAGFFISNVAFGGRTHFLEISNQPDRTSSLFCSQIGSASDE